VAIQIAYGRAHHVPWGISESASGDLDINKTYQYDAFGVPALGLKRGLAEKTVIAPYATLLAMNIAPRESLRNLRRLADLGLLDRYGYYAMIQPKERVIGGVIATYGPSSGMDSGIDQPAPWHPSRNICTPTRACAVVYCFTNASQPSPLNQVPTRPDL
jgi:hypothetical protein